MAIQEMPNLNAKVKIVLYDPQRERERELGIKPGRGRERDSIEEKMPGNEFAALISGLERLYSTLAEGMGYPPHSPYVVEIRHPNTSITVEGIDSAIGAMSDLLRSVPQVISNFITLPDLIRADRERLKADAAENRTRAKIAEEEEIRARMRISEIENPKTGRG